jgi:hypothetical protein
MNYVRFTISVLALLIYRGNRKFGVSGCETRSIRARSFARPSYPAWLRTEKVKQNSMQMLKKFRSGSNDLEHLS